MVSEGAEARKRDYEDKRRDYALAAIPEYWTVDPELNRITVLVLQADGYKLHGEFARGETATSKLLPELEVDVTKVMQLGDAN